MKRNIVLLITLVGLIGPMTSHAQDMSKTFQNGLFQEEANQDLAAAIEAYEEVLSQFEAKKHIAASALFRLGECYRKQGETKKAAEFYRRLMTEFEGQETLVRLAKQNLKAIDRRLPESASPATTPSDPQGERIAYLKEMIRQSPDLINAVSTSGKTPLQEAAAQGRLKVAEFLIENGAKVDRPDPQGQTALHYAARKGHKAMAELLIKNGAKINARENRKGRTPLHFAVLNGFNLLTETLLKHGADPDVKGTGDLLKTPGYAAGTALHLASYMGYPTLVSLLLDHGASVGLQDNRGETPLLYAVKRQNRAIAKTLLANGANVHHQDNDGRTPLHGATADENIPLVKLLLKKGADPNVLDDDKTAPLHRAVHEGNLEIIKLLLSHDADPNLKLENGQAPLHLAIDNDPASKRSAVVKALLENGAKIDATDADGVTPLRVAADEGNVKVARILLEHGADPNHFSSKGTPLHGTVDTSSRMVELLLEHGADVNATSSKYNVTQTPLISAVFEIAIGGVGEAAIKSLPILLENGANPNVKWAARNQNTALHVLCERISKFRYGGSRSKRILSAVRMLLDHGANPNLLNQQGETCFDLKQVQESKPLRQTLMEHGRRFLILIQREDRKRPIFYKRPDSLNEFTLYEAVYELYNPRTPDSFELPDFFKEFPDLTQIKIRSIANGNKKGSTKTVNLKQAASEQGCADDVRLQWGDIIQIPEAEHKLGAHWSGLPSSLTRQIQDCLKREITLTLPGESHSVSLVAEFPSWKRTGVLIGRSAANSRTRSDSTSHRGGYTKPGQSKTEDQSSMPFFRLDRILGYAQVLRSSSDKSRIRLTRTVPGEDNRIEATFDLEKANYRTDLWLKDGDVIHIPEK